MNGKKRILLTGISGLLGGNLAVLLRDKYEIIGIYNNHNVHIDKVKLIRLDLNNNSGLEKVFEEHKPDILVHAAAVTNVEDCEKYQDLALKNNVKVTEQLVKNVKAKGTEFVFISTDAFFENQAGHCAAESDMPKPMNYYGETKYLCEQIITQNMDRYIIVRTNFYGWNIQNKHSLGEWIYFSLKKNLQINLFTDVFFAPIFVNNLVQIIDHLIDIKYRRIINVAGSKSISKYDYGCLISEVFKLDKNLINPISVNNFTFSAPRSRNMALSVDKLLSVYPEARVDLMANIKDFYSCKSNGYFEMIKAENRGLII